MAEFAQLAIGRKSVAVYVRLLPTSFLAGDFRLFVMSVLVAVEKLWLQGKKCQTLFVVVPAAVRQNTYWLHKRTALLTKEGCRIWRFVLRQNYDSLTKGAMT